MKGLQGIVDVYVEIMKRDLISRDKARDAFLGFDREDVDLIQGEVVENELEPPC